MPNYTGIPEEDKTIKDQDLEFTPSTIETVDYALYDYIDGRLDLRVTGKDGWEKVPIIWASAERSFQVKNNPEYRDNEGTVILPAITIERTSVNKDLSRKGGFYGNQFPIETQKEKGGNIIIARRINQNKTSEFANADANRRYEDRAGPKFARKATKKVVYEYISMPPIVYVVMNYELTLRTEYQQQMNELLQPFVTKPGIINSFVAEREGHSYEAFIQASYDFSNNLSSMENDERKFETKVNIEVLGYLIGEDKNQPTPTFSIRENAVEFRIPRERVVLGDELSGNNNYKNKGVDGKYRE
jgi:hypothetical protein